MIVVSADAQIFESTDIACSPGSNTKTQRLAMSRHDSASAQARAPQACPGLGL